MSSQTLQNFIVSTPLGLWKNEFIRNDIDVGDTPELKNYLAKKLAETRLSLPDLEYLFIEHAIKKGIDENIANQIWDKTGDVLKSNIGLARSSNDINSTVKMTLKEASLDKEENMEMIHAFRKLCSELITMNLNNGSTNQNYAIGVMGELFAYLYALDIENYDCIHHKLVPDNASTFRHGMDLLGVKFDEENEKNDRVYFIEAKATTTNIISQRNEIINWFNKAFATKANTMIDQAKRMWKLNYPIKYVRANRALSRIQINLNEIMNSPSLYVGSVLIDKINNPKESELIEFKKIESRQKQILLIKTTSLTNLSQEVFDLACTI